MSRERGESAPDLDFCRKNRYRRGSVEGLAFRGEDQLDALDAMFDAQNPPAGEVPPDVELLAQDAASHGDEPLHGTAVDPHPESTVPNVAVGLYVVVVRARYAHKHTDTVQVYGPWETKAEANREAAACRRADRSNRTVGRGPLTVSVHSVQGTRPGRYVSRPLTWGVS